MTDIPVRRLSCAETAKLIRAELKTVFPGVKFSVRSRTYAGGASIDVSSTDGPSSQAVEVATDKFRRADFNGMIEYRAPTLFANEDGSYEEVRYGADFISGHREMSEEARSALLAEVEELLGREASLLGRVPVHVEADGSICRLTGSEECLETVLYRMAIRRAAVPEKAPGPDGR